LVAFDRIHLNAGESRKVTLHVEPRQLQYWSAKDSKWVTAGSKRTVSVGGSSRYLPVEKTIN
jgi:beta-glucosidase